jgi:fatty acid desaturase
MASDASEYAELKQLIKEKGLLDKQFAFYASRIALAGGFLVASVLFLVFVSNPWLQLLNAVFLAFVFGQIGFILHDSGHRQIFWSVQRNEIICLATSLFLGIYRTWWVEKHDKHHAHPNQVDFDPDINFPVLAFSEEQALKKKGIWRVIVKYQAYFFLPMLCLEGLNMRVASVRYGLRNKLKYPVLEPAFTIVHVAAYAVFLWWVLPSVWHVILFAAVHQAFLGIYMGSVFAPNHKGMPILARDTEIGFLRRQVITARNIKSHPLTDFVYGGLNYQVEHHLFPSMPRNKLREAQKIVKRFCSERNIPYHEVGVLCSQKEILKFLHEVSSPLRR